MERRKMVAVVDDDESVRESLPDLIRAMGFEVTAYSSAWEFLQSKADEVTDCLVLDVTMPGMSGPELQRELVGRESSIPIIFITATNGEDLRRSLLAGGAVACLFKPFSDDELQGALDIAFRKPHGD
jgi:FixJ family two-component response regulator